MTESRTYEWGKIRDAAITAWGRVPQGQLEADVIAVFKEHPALVEATIAKITPKFQDGRIKNPWAILRLELQKASNLDHNPTVTDEKPREKAVARAEQWVRTAGIHFDRESEIPEELFDSGIGSPQLAAWKTDAALRERILNLWREHRPAGEQVEREADERGIRDQTNRQEQKLAAKADRDRLDQIQLEAKTHENSVA